MDSFSMSNSLSKGSIYESESFFKAYQDDAMSRLEGDAAPVAISNEEIHRNDSILETYRVESDAIHGGMGSVWRVHHRSWNTDLAMKRPQPRFFAEGSDQRKADFISECEHWINLGLHPNIVSCYYVRDIGGVPTIFSEWMDGGSLKDAIQSGRLYEGTDEEVRERILDIAIQTARGLAYSHEQGLIHQDVKPGNILLTKEWEAKVADFGLAKAQSQLSDGKKPASSGYTLAYCPREQAEGAEAAIWMDVYAWTLTVMEMYAGKRLWETGAEAASAPRALLEACLVPKALYGLMEDCLRERHAFNGEGGVLSSLETAYAQCFGVPYSRTLPDAFSATAGFLNNRGLSFLDLGMAREAQKCLIEAFRLNSQNLEVAANSAMLLWNAGQLSDLEALGRLENCRSDSEAWARRMDTLKTLTGHLGQIMRRYYSQSLALIGGDAKVVSLWSGEATLEGIEAEGKSVQLCKGDWIKALSASRDGGVFALSGYSEVLVWRTGEPEPFMRFGERLGKDISYAAVSGSGDYVAVQQDRDIHIFRTRDGASVCKVSNVQRFGPLNCFAGDRLLVEGESGDALFRVYDLEPLKGKPFRVDPALLPAGQAEGTMLSDKRYAVQLITGKLGKCVAAFRGKELGIWEVETGRMLAYYPDDTVFGDGGNLPSYLCLCGEDDAYLACRDGMIRWRDGVRFCSCEQGEDIVSVGMAHVLARKGYNDYCLSPIPAGQSIQPFLELSRIRSLKLALTDQQEALRLMREAQESMDAGAFDEAREPLFKAEGLLSDALLEEWIGLYRRLSARSRRGEVLRYLNLGQLRMDGKIRAAAFRVNSDTLCAWDDHGEKRCLSAASQPVEGPCAMLVRTPADRHWMNEKPSYIVEMIDPSPFFDAQVNHLYYCDRWITSSEENPNTDLVETEGQITLKVVDLATRGETAVDPGHAYSDTGNTEYAAAGAISPDESRVLLWSEEKTGGRTQGFLAESDAAAGETVDRSEWLDIAPFQDFCCGGVREAEWFGGYAMVSSDGDFAALPLDDHTLELRLLIRRCEVLPASDDVSEAGKLPEIFHALHPDWTETDFEGLLAELRIRGLGHIRPEAVRAHLFSGESCREMPVDTFSLSNTLSKGSVNESDSIFKDYGDEAASRLADGLKPASISNEEIHQGDVILETYRMEDDAIHGGMGSVWRIHHENWDIDLAMKRPQPRFFSESSEKRKADFVSECEHWIDLGLHPNIVSCYYVREIGGVPTIFSEWMDGGSLRDVIGSGALYEGSETEVQSRILDIAIQMARGLMYAHENKLIHQDVKPGNILLSREWDAKIADFGLAKAQSQLTDGTADRSSGYTLAYCPKEQVEGWTPEKWMDIYAWALTVAEMYVGQRSWNRGQDVRGRLAEILKNGRIPAPAGVCNLLDDAINRAFSGFARILERLEQVYERVCQAHYDRPRPNAAADTADSLNNRALSFLDLGKADEAERLWQRALRVDATGFYSRYNYELWRWTRGQTSDIHFHDAIFRLGERCGAAALARARISLCRRADMSEAEKCMDALEKRWDVAFSDREMLSRSWEKWRKIEDTLPKLPADPFSEESKQAEAVFLPSEGLTSDFPRIKVKGGSPLRIEEADTGRILREMDVLTAINTGDEAEEWIQGYTPEGGALLHAMFMYRRCIALPDPEIPFSYEPAVVESYVQRRVAEEQAAGDYRRAKTAWEAGRILEAAQALDRSLKRGTMVLHEPSMALWTELGRHFPKGALVAAVPTPASATELPKPAPDPTKICQKEGDVFNQGWACISCDGVTELKLACSRLVARENANCNTDAEFTYCVTATDVATGQPVFWIDPFFNKEEDDDAGPFSRYQLRMDTPGKLILWSQYETERTFDILNLWQGLTRIALPGGYDLKNTPDGVEIGGVLYSDRFTEYRPLFNADIIPCRDHNYRLIYEYDLSCEPLIFKEEGASEVCEDASTDAAEQDAEQSASASCPISGGGSASTTSGAGQPALEATIQKGDVLAGEYEILGDAVFGGMSIVWPARRLDTGEACAVIRPLTRGSAAWRRFEESHALWAALERHPNIVACLEIREIEGIPTAVCEWIDGCSLRVAIQDGSLYAGAPEEVRQRVFDIAAQIASSLRLIHGKGVVHCDVKPANLLLGHDGTVKLNDFGLARRIPSKNAPVTEPAPGFTPAYCPKEQAEGRPAQPWMDVCAWALAVLEMYMGNRPWQTGAEAVEGFDEYLPACRVTPPENMVKLLRCCLKWKVSDGSVVAREMEKILHDRAGEAEKPASDTAKESPVNKTEDYVSQKASAEHAACDPPAEQTRGGGLGGLLGRLIFGKKRECRRGNHDWNGCICRNCGAKRHDFQIVRVERQAPGCCCWSSNDDCVGPDCGTPCDSYYPGREGKTVTTWKCTRCGLEKTEE